MPTRKWRPKCKCGVHLTPDTLEGDRGICDFCVAEKKLCILCGAKADEDYGTICTECAGESDSCDECGKRLEGVAEEDRGICNACVEKEGLCNSCGIKLSEKELAADRCLDCDEAFEESMEKLRDPRHAEPTY